MSFQPFKIFKDILNPLKSKAQNAIGSTGTSPINPAGVVDFNAANVRYLNNTNEKSGFFYQYPTEARDQEHYILIDIIERLPQSDGTGGELVNTGSTLRGDNLSDIVLNTNRFFGEGGKIAGIPSGKGSRRRVKNTVAIYMPQTVKFQFAADYGAAEIGNIVGMGAKLKDFFTGAEGTGGANFGASAAQLSKLLDGGVEFFSLGTAAGLGASIQRRTGIAPAAMTEMIFNGIDYRSFSFDFKFTPRSYDESVLVREILDVIKSSMLPRKFGTGSIAAYTVPDEFVLRFMKGNNINPYLDQVGLCACTGVDITYGGDKFSTHAVGDPVTIDATLSFRELELVERDRYTQLRNSARGVSTDTF